MMLDRIIIVDDKAPSEDYSTFSAFHSLSAVQKERVEYFSDTKQLWKEAENGDEVILLTDFSRIKYVFLHDSFNDPLFPDGLLPVLIKEISKTSQVILFSGSKSESSIPLKVALDPSIAKDIFYFEILRKQYFNNLSSFIESLFVFGEFKLNYLYNSDIPPYKDKGYELLDEIKDKLESSTAGAIRSDAFKNLLKLYRYENVDSISNRFEIMTIDEIIEALEDLVENN